MPAGSWGCQRRRLAGLGWQRYVEPLWVTVPSGVILALIAPALAVGEHGWVYAIGIATAAAAMAASVRLRNTPLLALPGRAGDVWLRHVGGGPLLP